MNIGQERFLSAVPRLIWAVERDWSSNEARNWGAPYHSHENTTWFVRSGRAFVTGADGNEVAVEAGEWMFFAPGMMRRRFEGPFGFLSIGLRWRWPEGNHLFCRGLPLNVSEPLPSLLEEMQRVIAETAGLVPSRAHWFGDLNESLAVHVRLHDLAARWACGFAGAMEYLNIPPEFGQPLDPRLEAVQRVVNQLPVDAAYDAEAVVSASGFSERQLKRLYREETGSTPREFFDQRRYEHVRHELLMPGVRIKEAAAGIGFTDLAAFNRWFLRRAGLPPRAFRDSMRR